MSQLVCHLLFDGREKRVKILTRAHAAAAVSLNPSANYKTNRLIFLLSSPLPPTIFLVYIFFFFYAFSYFACIIFLPSWGWKKREKKERDVKSRRDGGGGGRKEKGIKCKSNRT